MAVTSADRDPRDAALNQVERIVHSPVLHSSESLCKLLRYLVQKSLEQPGIALKEYQIATEVFGRSDSFDPRLDSTVRVQTGRLRSKLSEYYAAEGAGDEVIIEIPKGSYLVALSHREPPERREEPPPKPERSASAEPVRPASPENWWRNVALLLVGVLSLTLGALAYVVLRGQPAAAPRPPAGTLPAPLRAFWSPYLQHSEDPLVVFSNAAFVGRPETGLRYLKPETDSRAKVQDHYTGVGEVLAVHELDRVFFDLARPLQVKRGQLLSLDDVKNNDVIFVGSPSENLVLTEIPSTTDFVFRRAPSGPRRGDLAIFDTRPRPGEQDIYFAPAEPPITEDYAIVALRNGLNASRWEMILAGTTTLGTQAAVEYVTHERSIETLESRIPHWQPGALFEALLHVTIRRGVPVRSDLLAVHSSP
jgi:hypothetical protein